MTFKIVARTQAASEAVSLLNFEPEVSKFPVLEATRLLVLLYCTPKVRHKKSNFWGVFYEINL